MSGDGCGVVVLAALLGIVCYLGGCEQGHNESNARALCREHLTYHATTELDTLRLARKYECDLPERK